MSIALNQIQAAETADMIKIPPDRSPWGADGVRRINDRSHAGNLADFSIDRLRLQRQGRRVLNAVGPVNAPARNVSISTT